MSASGWIVRHLDLSARPEVLAAPPGLSVYGVFWWRGLLLGVKPFAAGELPLDRDRLEILTAGFAARVLAARLDELGAPVPAGAGGFPDIRPPWSSLAGFSGGLAALDALADPPVRLARSLSVIICTRGRAPSLERTLQSLIVQNAPPLEILVVDNNAPDETATRETVSRFPEVRYVAEPRPGLSRARNAGVRAARGELIAFTDDDAVVRGDWTSEIVRAFDRPEVDGVTGAVLPAGLETLPQMVFQVEMGGFGEGCVPVWFDRRFFEINLANGPPVWRVGAGANMAFRREVFETVGLFDEALGAGAAGCSEDSELWYRMIAGGGVCLYEPRAVVFHEHRADWRDLISQMRAYNRGHVAALVAQGDRFAGGGDLRRIFVQLPLYFLRTAIGGFKNGPTGRHRLLGAQISGWASGLQYLWRERRRPVLRLAPEAQGGAEEAA